MSNHLPPENIYEDLNVTPDVLVIGSGSEATSAALAISKNQPVLIVDNGGGPFVNLNLVEGNANITVKSGTRVIGLDGFPGNFTVCLLDDGKASKQSFGCIVLALGARPRYDEKKYDGVELGGSILSLSQFSETCCIGSQLFQGMGTHPLRGNVPDECPRRDYAGKKVCFVLGKADIDSPLSLAVVLKAVLDMKEKGASEVDVLYKDMQVCADGLEQDYEKARRKGVNFLNYIGELQFLKSDARAIVRYREPFLSLDLLIAADYIVLAEDFVPAAETWELAGILDIRTGPGGFFQKDNVHFLPIRSNRAGIFFVGSCHGPIHGADLYNEIEAVVAETSAFSKGRVRVPALQPQVEAEKCAACLTCYRVCPHHAIEIVHGAEYDNMYRSAARMDPLACQHCGICAAECPGKAIQLPLYSDQDILCEVKQPARIVAYACKNSGFIAAEFAKTLDPELQKDLQIVEVPCAGRIDTIYLLKALEHGADGVMLLACHKENCKYDWGNNRAEQRAERAQKILNRIGMGERIDFVHVAANQGNRFKAAVREMADKINQSGTNPGRVAK